MKKRKLVSILLIMLILYNSLVFAFYEEKTNDQVVEMMMAQGYSKFYTKSLGNNIYLNPHVYRDQQKIVYSASSNYGDLRSTLHENQPLSENTDAKGEYRYLGYNKSGDVVANGMYIPDVSPESGQLSTRNWQEDSGAEASWDTLDNVDMIAYMLDDMQVKVDANVGVDTVTGILGKSVSESKKIAIFQTEPGVKANGSVKMYHLNNSGQLLYWVLKIPAFGDYLKSTFDIQDINDMTAIEGDDVNLSVNLNNNVTFSNDLSGTYDVSKFVNNLYESFDVIVNGVIVSNISNTESVDSVGVYNSNIAITIDSSALSLGLNDVVIKGQNSYDSFLNSDQSTPVLDQIDFTIAVTSYGTPNASLTVIPDPSSVITNGSTSTVDIELRANLKGVDNIPPVWKYRLNGETFLIKGNGTQQSSTTITKTISTSSVSSYVWNGEVDVYTDVSNFVTATDSATTKVYDTVPPAPINTSPDVFIDAPPIAVMGANVVIRTNASDREDPVSSLTYSYTKPASMSGVLDIDGGTVVFSQEGEFTVSVEVTDSSGKTSSDSTSIWIIAPTPVAKLDVYGIEKVNREIKLTGVNSIGSVDYPIDWSKTTFKIIPLEGQDVSKYWIGTSAKSDATINTLTKVGYDSIYLQTGQNGKIDVELTVTNSIGYSSTQTKQLDIKADVRPDVHILSPNKVYRDPANGNKQTTNIYNISNSSDNDTFDKTVYLRQVDTDNDSNYDEENLEVYNGSIWSVLPYKISSLDSNKYNLMVNYSISPIEIESTSTVVGKTKFNLIVSEDFNDRNHNLLSANDYIFSTVGNNDMKVTDVDNVAPTADVVISSQDTERVELVVMTDYQGTDLVALKNEITNLQTEMVDYGKSMIVHYISSKNHVSGSQTLQGDEYLYNRNAYLSYRKYGTEDHSSSGFKNVDYYENETITMESIYSLSTPSTNLFQYGNNVEYRTVYDTESHQTSMSGWYEKFYDVQVYDTSNIIDSMAQGRARIYKEGDGLSYAYIYDYSQSMVSSSLNLDLTSVNSWTKTATSRVVDITSDINSFKLTDITDLTLDPDTKKVLLVASQGYRTHNFTLGDGAEYSFASLNANNLPAIADYDFDTFVLAPESVLDWKFNNNQYNTTVNSQSLTLRDLSKVGGVGGIITKVSDSLNYLKADNNSDLQDMITINNTSILIDLSETLDKYDSVLVSIFGDIVLSTGEVLTREDFEGIKEYSGDVFPLIGGIFMTTIDTSRQYIELGYLDNPSNHFVYKVVRQNNLVIKEDDIVNWTAVSGNAINAVVGQFVYVAEVDSSNRVKYMSVREVK